MRIDTVQGRGLVFLKFLRIMTDQIVRRDHRQSEVLPEEFRLGGSAGSRWADQQHEHTRGLNGHCKRRPGDHDGNEWGRHPAYSMETESVQTVLPISWRVHARLEEVVSRRSRCTGDHRGC